MGVGTVLGVSDLPGVLARGPWDPTEVEVSWRTDPFEPAEPETAAADRALDALRERGSPSHDGLAGRLAGYELVEDRLKLELQPARWSLRLNPDNAVAQPRRAVRRAPGRRTLARRTPGAVAGVVGRPLGARSRWVGRGRREPDRHD